MRVVSSAYLRLLIFLPAILIPACASFSPAFHMMYLHISYISRVTIYSLDILLFLFGTSLLFHKVLHSICQQIWKTQQWPQDWKRSVFIPIPKKHNAKECSNYHKIALISHASKVMLKILQARLQQYVHCELPDVQAGFRKGRGTRDQIANICWIIKKSKRVPEKHLFLLC